MFCVDSNFTTQGDLTFNLTLDGIDIGQAYLTDFTLRPGNNNYNMNSNMKLSVITTYITQPGTPYSNGILPIKATGVQCSHNGVVIPYLTKAISSLTLTYKLSLPDTLSTSTGTIAPLLGTLQQFVFH